MTALALGLFALAAHRLVARAGLRFEAVARITIFSALVPFGYGLLAALSWRRRSSVPLTFYDRAGAPVRVAEDWVLRPLANPGGLLIVAAVVALIAFLLPARTWLEVAPSRPTRRRFDGRMLLIAACLLPYALTLFGALASPPRGYDALWYHLPAAVEFSRAHHLEPPGRDLVFYFPANLELLARALLDAFGPRALALVQWPFAVGAALAAHALARAIGFARQGAWAAALVLATPMVAFQSQLAYADLLALFCVGSAAAFLVRAGRTPRLGEAAVHAALAGAALGLLVGAKYAALPLVAALAPVALVHFAAPEGWLSARHLRRALGLSAIVVAVALAPSWFWYARNLRLTGNPLFPIDVPALGWHGLFTAGAFNPGKERELVAHAWQWAVYPWIEKLSHESGLGAAFACLAPLGAVALGLRALAGLVRGRVSPFALPLGWGALYPIAWWVGTNHEARHLLPLVMLLGVPSVGLIRGRALATPVAAALAFSTVFTLRTLLFSPVPELSVRARSFADVYACSLPPDQLARVPEGAKIVNRADRPANFPLYGPSLRLRVQHFTPALPSARDLRSYDAAFLFHRGPPSELPAWVGWHPVFRAAVSPTATWWDVHPGDELTLLRHD